MANIVIGIEGYVGAGKTSICRELLNHIPNSIILHGGNLYRAIIYSVMKQGIDLDNLKQCIENKDIKEIMDSLNIKIDIEDRQSVVYVNGQILNENAIQSIESSLAVSMVGNKTDNSKFYIFANTLIRMYAKQYNLIVSGRDLMKIYPDLNYHFLVNASLDIRVDRKYTQYMGKIDKKEIKDNILKRDELQKQAGYYNIYDNTISIDVSNTNSIKESAQEVLKYIK